MLLGSGAPATRRQKTSTASTTPVPVRQMGYAQQAQNPEAAAAVAEVKAFEYLPTPIRRRKAFSNAGGAGLAVGELSPRDPKAIAEIEALAASLFNIQ